MQGTINISDRRGVLGGRLEQGPGRKRTHEDKSLGTFAKKRPGECGPGATHSPRGSTSSPPEQPCQNLGSKPQATRQHPLGSQPVPGIWGRGCELLSIQPGLVYPLMPGHSLPLAPLFPLIAYALPLASTQESSLET